MLPPLLKICFLSTKNCIDMRSCLTNSHSVAIQYTTKIRGNQIIHILTEVVSVKIFAIDQAKTAGYALFVDGRLERYGTIELGKKSVVYEDMLFSAREKVRGLVLEMEADFILIEDIQQQRQNVKTFKKLAMLMGVLVCLFQEMGKPHMVVPPARWKGYCGIKGKKRDEQKANTILFVEGKFGLDGITEDIADAVSLCWYGVENIGKGVENAQHKL